MNRRSATLSTALAAASVIAATSFAAAAAATTSQQVGSAVVSSSPEDAAHPCTPRTAASGTTTPADSSPTEAAADLPAWQTLPITDVDGVTFTLADCIGTPVLVELFATWCSTCREQMPDTQEAAATLGDGVAVIALSVETDLSPDAVAEYAVELGLDDIRFAVLSPELLAAFVEAFGNTVANPPSTPKLVVDADGVAGELTTGAESAEDLVAKLTAAAAPADSTATTTG